MHLSDLTVVDALAVGAVVAINLIAAIRMGKFLRLFTRDREAPSRPVE